MPKIWYKQQYNEKSNLARNRQNALTVTPCPPIDSILKLMTVWKITGKIRTTTIVNYICTRIWCSYNFRFSSFFVFCVSYCKGQPCRSITMCLCAFCLERPSPK